ncbi:hypothetical protein [Nonomuraea salmonea]|uniref:Uncharacterized protein n=1 Tax=Nonomuraea salmonea TaxID=46181 RepID=A0ABV5P2R6_9ACTN
MNDQPERKVFNRDWVETGLYVHRVEPGLYELRQAATGHPRSSQFRLPAMRTLITNRRWRCPDIEKKRS